MDSLRQFNATHAGHDHIGEHRVKPIGIFGKLSQRRLRIGRPNGLVAEFGQGLRGEGAHVRVVLDHQHAGAEPVDQRRHLRGAHGSDLLFDPRQIEGAPAALTGRSRPHRTHPGRPQSDRDANLADLLKRGSWSPEDLQVEKGSSPMLLLTRCQPGEQILYPAASSPRGAPFPHSLARSGSGPQLPP